MKFYKAQLVPRLLPTRSGIIKLKEFEIPSGGKYVAQLKGNHYVETKWNSIEDAIKDLDSNYYILGQLLEW
jgi:hypothetical protein